jgi:hypothetical protein
MFPLAGSLAADECTRAAAQLAVRVGANVAPGQDVVVAAFDVDRADLARAIAEEAYRAGALRERHLYWNQRMKRSRLLYAPEESLEHAPSWWDRYSEECIEKRSAHILVWGDPASDLLDGIDPARAARDRMPLTEASFAMIASEEVDWTIVPGVSPSIAAGVLGAPDVGAYRRLPTPILRRPDPSRGHMGVQPLPLTRFRLREAIERGTFVPADENSGVFVSVAAVSAVVPADSLAPRRERHGRAADREPESRRTLRSTSLSIDFPEDTQPLDPRGGYLRTSRPRSRPR